MISENRDHLRLRGKRKHRPDIDYLVADADTYQGESFYDAMLNDLGGCESVGLEELGNE